MSPIISFIIIVFLGNLGVRAEHGKHIDTCSIGYLAKADSLLKIGDFDNAIIQYFMASENGMTQDSLYYFWAELYLKKGNPDSALAANSFALKKTDTATTFKEQLYIQRYSIFTFLGADSLANDIWKKIFVEKSNKKTRFKSSLKANLSLRYEPDKIDAPILSYWSLGNEDSINNEFSGIVRLTAEFQYLLSSRKKTALSFGPYFMLKKSSNLSSQVSSAFDSLNVDMGGYFSLDNLFKTLRVEFRSGANSDRYFTKRWVNGISYSYINEQGNFFLAGGYNIATKKHLKYDYQFGYQSFIMDFDIKKSFSISPLLTLSYFGSEDDIIKDNSLSSLSYIYFNSSKLNENMVPQFYKDIQMINELDTTNLNGGSRLFYFGKYIDQLQQNSTSVTALLDLPQTYFRIEPGINAGISVNKWRFRPSVKFNLDIYNGLFRWHDFNFEYLTPYLAKDPLTNKYYQIIGLNSSGTVDLSNFGIGEITGSLYTHSRMDFGIHGEFSVSRKFKKTGTFKLFLGVAKYWTTLPAICPVSFNSYSITCNVDWNYTHMFIRNKTKNAK